MSDLEIIGQMIKESAKVPLKSTDYGKVCVVLTEHQTTNSSITICGIPSDAIVVKVDKFKSPDSIFNGNNGECKRADYVIFSDNGGKKRILYIEIKKTNDSPKDIVDQLTGAMCFVSYCKEIGRAFWKEGDFLKDYQNRFVSIGHTSVSKRSTRITRSDGKHVTPDKRLIIDWPRYLQFNHLAS